MSVAPFDPLRAVMVLQRHDVRFIIVGGLAASVLGSPTVTNDFDLCYSRDTENLIHLAEALRELNATLRGSPADLPFQLDERTLRLGDSFTFQTDAGNLDCIGTPSGTTGYEDLFRSAIEIDLGDGTSVRITSLDDLIRMKKAAGRPKDLIELEILAALRDEAAGGS